MQYTPREREAWAGGGLVLTTSVPPVRPHPPPAARTSRVCSSAPRSACSCCSSRLSRRAPSARPVPGGGASSAARAVEAHERSQATSGVPAMPSSGRRSARKRSPARSSAEYRRWSGRGMAAVAVARWWCHRCCNTVQAAGGGRAPAASARYAECPSLAALAGDWLESPRCGTGAAAGCKRLCAGRGSGKASGGSRDARPAY